MYEPYTVPSKFDHPRHILKDIIDATLVSAKKYHVQGENAKTRFQHIHTGKRRPTSAQRYSSSS